jgi:hypothetical protein
MLLGVAGGVRPKSLPNTPSRVRAARTCYDHIAGSLRGSLHDRFRELGLAPIQCQVQ